VHTDVPLLPAHTVSACQKMGGGAASQSSGKTVEQAHQPTHNGWGTPVEDEVQWLRRALEQEKREKEWLMTRFEQQTFGPASSSGSKQSANGTPDPMVMKRMQEELGLLRKALDAEKVEKEWLMKRFERVESDLHTRTQECAQLREKLLEARPAVAPGQLPSLTPVGLEERHKNQQLPELPGQLSSPSPTEVLSPNSTGSGSLKARRGLNLTVATGKKPEKTSSDGITKLPEKPPVENAPMQENPQPEKKELAPSKRQEFLQRLQESGPITNEPMTACVFSSSKRSTWAATNNEEPMSPLLRRRRGTAGTQDVPTQSMRSLIMSQQVGGGLSISTPKLEKLEDDVPMSPKLVRSNRRRRSGPRASDCQSIAE